MRFKDKHQKASIKKRVSKSEYQKASIKKQALRNKHYARLSSG
jgi:hypothetical protein